MVAGPRDPLAVDFGGRSGNLLVVGGIFSGKSTLLRTLILSLGLTNSPNDVQFYCLDPEGRLEILRSMPHVKAVVKCSDVDEVARLIDHVLSIIATRRTVFGSDEFRATRSRIRKGNGPYPDLFLVIDGWELCTEDVSSLTYTVPRIAGRGLAFGVHVVITTRHWDHVNKDLARLVLGRIELTLDDPSESRISSAMASQLPGSVGWGLYQDKSFLVALPRLDEGEGDYALDDALATIADSSDTTWSGYQTFVSDAPIDLPELLGLSDAMTFDVQQAWRPRSPRDVLRVPFGVDEYGQPVELDIKEAAAGGKGPHGLCVGATGSGKSEFLRTLILGLAVTHSPENLNFVLVDFKGGATFRALEKLPHVAAVITNLGADLSLVDRMKDALYGEMNRRQELLRQAGNLVSAREYERVRAAGRHHLHLDPLPALFIVIDEFSELLVQQPDFIDLFVAIGRLGRSLGIHLLLASQRLEEGRLRGLDSHLSYRIGLKTFSEAESRVVLGVPDAYELPSMPGSGYLKVDFSTLVRFRSAYVSGPALRPAPNGYPGLEPSLLDVIVERLCGQGPAAHEVWLPPLDEPPSLDQLLPPLSATEDRGLSPVGFFGNGRLTVPVGIVDKPYEQRRDLLWADFSGAAGHAVVTGGPQSGKSSLLRSMLLSLALTHTPEEVQFFGIDLGAALLRGDRKSWSQAVDKV